MSKLFAMVVPILPGKEEGWKKWHNELTGSRYQQFVESRKRLKVHERTFLQHTPMGDMVIITLEGDDPKTAFMGFASANDDFTNWFVEGVKELHGIDLRNPPDGPLPELIIDSASQTQ